MDPRGPPQGDTVARLQFGGRLPENQGFLRSWAFSEPRAQSCHLDSKACIKSPGCGMQLSFTSVGAGNVRARGTKSEAGGARGLGVANFSKSGCLNHKPQL